MKVHHGGTKNRQGLGVLQSVTLLYWAGICGRPEKQSAGLWSPSGVKEKENSEQREMTERGSFTCTIREKNVEQGGPLKPTERKVPLKRSAIEIGGGHEI